MATAGKGKERFSSLHHCTYRREKIWERIKKKKVHSTILQTNYSLRANKEKGGGGDSPILKDIEEKRYRKLA